METILSIVEDAGGVKNKIPSWLQKDGFGFVKLKPHSKIPFAQDWQNNPYTYSNIQSHINQGGNSGVVDEVWLIPTGRHRDKEHHASCDHRKAMVSIMLAMMFGSRVPVHLNTAQIDAPWIKSSSANLIRTMEERYPSLQFFLVIGSDLIRDIPNRKNLNKSMQKSLLCEGRYIRLVEKNGWEYVERTNCAAIVGIIAITNSGKIVFAEQKRVPIGTNVIEFPAGLVGDTAKKNEDMLIAAKRELLEEIGYRADKWTLLVEGPISSGLTSEKITFFMATGLRKIGRGGGDKSEFIVVHEVPLSNAEHWLETMRRKGRAVDPKVFAGLYFAKAKGKN